MKPVKFFAVVVFGLFSACSGPQQPMSDAMLVERFDVTECEGVEPVRMAGAREESLQKVTREYFANAGCSTALEKAALALDFEKERDGKFVAQRKDGWTETLAISDSTSGSKSTVVWEEAYP